MGLPECGDELLHNLSCEYGSDSKADARHAAAANLYLNLVERTILDDWVRLHLYPVYSHGGTSLPGLGCHCASFVPSSRMKRLLPALPRKHSVRYSQGP